MLWTIIVILLLLWLFGFLGAVGGSLVHLLLVFIVVALVLQFFWYGPRHGGPWSW